MHYCVALEYWYLDYSSTTGIFSNVDGKSVLVFAIATGLDVVIVNIALPVGGYSRAPHGQTLDCVLCYIGTNAIVVDELNVGAVCIF